jgi:hypothetical protein
MHRFAPTPRDALRTFVTPILIDTLQLGIDYGGLVVSPACFARAESRSSLNPDSLSLHAIA